MEGCRLRAPSRAQAGQEEQRSCARRCWLLTRPDPEEQRAVAPEVEPCGWANPLDAGPDRGQTGSAGRNPARPCRAAPEPRDTNGGGSRVLLSSGLKLETGEGGRHGDYASHK
ncbi:hypothetical protein NDU88_008452 [Pleurodeles waltl]|uniref:Uncharacterized protein n=1 Tax=Pleurodeles waltl TaxID=8319 RepID=A0AAV7PPI1_PLEWA|nr:hypothetical protein NDU88_008452 [Pleurodeles waltl]